MGLKPADVCDDLRCFSWCGTKSQSMKRIMAKTTKQDPGSGPKRQKKKTQFEHILNKWIELVCKNIMQVLFDYSLFH